MDWDFYDINDDDGPIGNKMNPVVQPFLPSYIQMFLSNFFYSHKHHSKLQRIYVVLEYPFIKT